MIEPHGGRLVNRIINAEHADQVQSEVADSPTIRLDNATYQDLINISNGRYSPLSGFMRENDFLKVIHDMTLEDGTVWPLPIICDVSSDVADEITLGEKIGLRDPAGELIGAVKAEELYKCDKSEVVEDIYGTSDREHPGVQKFLNLEDFFVGGNVFVFAKERYNDADLFPKETRVLFDHNEWDTVVGFQTRNAPHRAHEYIQKSGLEQVDGLLVQPKLGHKKPGDYCDEAILGAYQVLLRNYYPDNRTALSVFPSKMNYAGPREAIFDAVVRKNQGCTHFIVGRDHAGVKDYYGGFEAQCAFDEIDIGITPLFYDYAFYCETCDGMVSEKVCPHDDDVQVHPSGSKIRKIIKSGSTPSEKMMRPEVAEYLTRQNDPFIERPAKPKQKT